MVIHFYKRMSYKELKPIMEMLERLNFDIPVIIVSISKTISREFLVFDEGFEGKMPLNGSYFSLGENRYLFCNNARQNKQDSPLKLPLPLKIELQSSHETELKDPILVEKCGAMFGDASEQVGILYSSFSNAFFDETP